MPEQLCPFCHLDAGRIYMESDSVVAFPDGFPITPGHILVIPRRHVASLFDLSEAEQTAVWKIVALVRSKLISELKPDGFTIGVNDGAAAGQTVLHAHIHVIPRRLGDIADPRGGVRWVLPQKAPYWDPSQK